MQMLKTKFTALHSYTQLNGGLNLGWTKIDNRGDALLPEVDCSSKSPIVNDAV